MTQALDRLFDRLSRRPRAAHALMAVEAPGRDISWRRAAPRIDLSRPFFVASASKLFTVALAVQLAEAGRLDLEAPAFRYLPDAMIDGLHVRRGVDRSRQVTVRQLLSNTSGLPDYFQQDSPRVRSPMSRIRKGQDMAFTRQQALNAVYGRLEARFDPGAPGRAFYSDTNFQLAGAVLETITGRDYAELAQERLFRPLGLKDTYVFTPATRDRYDEMVPVLLNRREVRLPGLLASVGPDGGGVTTLDDGLAFLKAFFGGRLFPVEWIGRMRDVRPIFFPFRYGLGMMHYALPMAFTGFRRQPALIGHAGASGVVMFHCPERDLYVCGSTNQIADPGLPFPFLTRVLMMMK